MALLTYLTTTHFDFGAVSHLAGELKRFGVVRPLIVTDAGVRSAGLLDRALHTIGGVGTFPIFSEAPAKPTEAPVLKALEIFRSERCDGIVVVGGGSAMDLGKAVALLADNEGPLARFDPARGGGNVPRRLM